MMKKYFKYFISAVLFVSLVAKANDDVLDLHPPVKVAYQGKEAIVLFLSNKEMVSVGTVYAISLPSLSSKAISVPSIARGKIISVFFYEKKSHNVRENEKSMFVLNEKMVDDESQFGSIYTLTRFSLNSISAGLLVQYFDSDNRDDRFINCFEGIYKVDNKRSKCKYNNYRSIINELSK